MKPECAKRIVKTAFHLGFLVLSLYILNYVLLFTAGLYASGSQVPNALQNVPMNNHGIVVYITVWQEAQRWLYIVSILTGFAALIIGVIYVRDRHDIWIFPRLRNQK